MMRKFILISLFLWIPFFAFAGERPRSIPKLIFFYSETCHECMKVKNEFMPEIENEFRGRVGIEYSDIAQEKNFIFLLGLKEKYRKDLKLAWPVVFCEGRFLSGSLEVKNNLKNLILSSLSLAPGKEEPTAIGLLDFFQRFKLFGIVAAGLEDGINPCAFTVIVFFISYLALQGYRKRELIVIGLVFIATVFLTYLLIGLGIFNSLYALKGFWLVTKAANILIGALSIILGVLALYDFFKFKKTGETEGLILQLPQAVKERIHAVIGLHYRASKEIAQPHIFRLVLSALVTGFLVSLLEAVCTGQLYLPTITLVFKTTPLKLKAFGYLALYNAMFIVPLLIIFFFALSGVTSEQFSKVLKKHLPLVKIMMALMFFALGIFLLWRA